MDNRFIQYANAPCAAQEIQDAGPDRADQSSFETLPSTFRGYLANELNPVDAIPPDLYVLKLRTAQGPAHHQFPMRGAAEPSFQIKGIPGGFVGNLGQASLAQALREAHPGAIYYYLGRHYRVVSMNHRDGTILAQPERHWTTKPVSQAMVFPNIGAGAFQLRSSERGFVAECGMQVSERLMGFVEQRGPNSFEVKFEVGCSYA